MKKLSSSIVADVLRQEIEAGKFRSGEVLPTVSDLRGRFGLGEYAVRRAVSLLRKEGLVDVRQHVGAVVSERALFKWRGRVAFVTVTLREAFYENSLAFSLSTEMEAEGWIVHHVSIFPDSEEKLDLTPLKRHLSAGIDFAVCLIGSHRVAAMLEQADVPYIVVDGFTRDFPGAHAVFRIDEKRCANDLVAHLHRLHVRSVLEVDYARVMERVVTQTLFAAGFRQMRLFGEIGKSAALPDVERYALRAMAEYLAKIGDTRKLPDAILFHDDFLARGGALALTTAGVRVPDDVHVVTISNAGNEPVFPFPVIRLEYDWRSYGVVIAKYVLGVLSGRRPAHPSLRLRLVPEGE